MSDATLTRQFILDASGKPIGVILPIEEYQELVQAIEGCTASTDQPKPNVLSRPSSRSLYGVLRRLGGQVAGTDGLDQALRDLWSAWDKGEDS
jgi:hypothetical protein